MAVRGRALRDRYPVFFAFEGEQPIRFLSPEESIAATPQERIKSIWPYLARIVMRFADTLRPRERANYDPEDILTEIWCKLAEKDRHWEPSRGRYITFAARVVGNELHKIRDRTRTVKSPNNSYCRLKEYEIEAKEERITDQRAATMNAMRRVLCDSETLDESEPSLRHAESAEMAAQRREEMDLFGNAIIHGIAGLSPEEANAISGAYGLWGGPEKAIEEIAGDRNTTHGTIKAAQSRARQKIRQRLVAMGHPAADLLRDTPKED